LTWLLSGAIPSKLQGRSHLRTSPLPFSWPAGLIAVRLLGDNPAADEEEEEERIDRMVQIMECVISAPQESSQKVFHFKSNDKPCL